MSVIEGMNRYIAEHITSDLGTDSFQIRKIVMIGKYRRCYATGFLRARYSYRNATIGSTLVARLAGK
jgi:hypothetical protein